MPAALQNHKLVIAYDGSAYRGWQRQKNGPSIQESIESALAKIWQSPLTLHGSGRTDTGVHAIGQVAHFHAPLKFRGMSELRNALNASLSPDIRIREARLVPEAFHARFSATGKMYRYELFCREFADPFLLHRAWQMRRSLDIGKMKEASATLCGTHDFAAFASNPGYRRENTVRSIQEIKLTARGSRVRLTFRGSGFLYKMVRNLTGALVRVGDGRMTVKELGRILKSADRSQAPPPAPAHGLYLQKVFYRQ